MRAHVKTEFAAYTDTDAVTVFTPSARATVESPTAGVRATGSYLADVVSAASVDIVSTASRRWTEVRHAVTLDAAYAPRDVGVTASGAVSAEPDYVSGGGGMRLSLGLATRTVNPFLGWTYSHDVAGKTGTPFSVYSQALDRYTLALGSELVLDRGTTAVVSVDAILERGDQKKPYRMLPVFDASVADGVPAGAPLALVNQLRLPGRMTERTPLARNRVAGTFRLARRFAAWTLILAERAYADDWGLLASTSDARLLPDLAPHLVLLLHARAHVQSGVDFWRRAYVARVGVEGPLVVPEYRTGDRELGPLLAGTAGVGLRLVLGAFAVSLQGDVTVTDFVDALYVRDRVASIGAVALEVDP